MSFLFSGRAGNLPQVVHGISHRFMGLAHCDVKWRGLEVIFVGGHRDSLGGSCQGYWMPVWSLIAQGVYATVGDLDSVKRRWMSSDKLDDQSERVWDLRMQWQIWILVTCMLSGRPPHLTI